MDQRLLFGLGVSVVFGFARWVWPAIPRWIGFAGLACGASLILWSFMPFIRPASAILGFASLLGIGAAIALQLRANEERRLPAIDNVSKTPTAESVPRPEEDQASSRNAAQPTSTKRVAAPAESAAPKKGPLEYESEMRETIARKAAERGAVLRQLTQLYILSHDGISPRMMAGMELPSADFLNAELARQGARWRVRNVNGANAEIYDLP